MQLDNKNKFPVLYSLLILAAVIMLLSVFQDKVDKIDYAVFKKMITQPYRIEECTISNMQVKGIYVKDDKVWKQLVAQKKKAGNAGAKPKKKPKRLFSDFFQEKEGRAQFYTTRVHDDPDLVKMLQKSGVPYRGEMESNWSNMFIYWILPLTIIIVLWVFLMRRMNSYGKDVMSFVKTKAKITAEEDTKTSFEDVAGCDEAKEELTEIVEFLKSPGKFELLGGKIPKGALLVGPPGTGKTLLAKAVAGEAGVPFFNISGSEFVEMFVGVGASRVRDLFHQAKSKPPCIVFIDEIDAVGRHRGAGLGGGHDEREQTLNQLLAEMDGFETNKGIIVLAATNRPDILDPALMRPGRFDRRIVIDQPDIRGREEILKIHARGKPLSQEVDLQKLAQRTPGFCGADLANIMNEAALLAARKDKSEIDQEDIAEAIERVIAGPERKSRIISAKEKRITAYHEVGHALLAELHPNGDPVHKVTIIPRGSALGYTLSLPEEDKYTKTREELLANICCLLGGRVAEEVGLDLISTGAQNDFQHVTDIARSYVARYGMSKKMGPLAFEREEGYVFLGRNFDRKSYFSGTTMDQIDREVRKIVLECYEKAYNILLTNKPIMDKIVEIILECETLEGSEFREILVQLREGKELNWSKNSSKNNGGGRCDDDDPDRAGVTGDDDFGDDFDDDEK